MSKLYSAGNTGIGVKSDCMVSYTPSQASLTIHIKSKVMPMFGKSILALAEKMMAFFDITTGELYIDDKGSLEYVLAARIEATIKQAFDTKKEYLLEINPENTNETQKDAFRFSRLYLPGNTPKLSLNAGVHKPNGLILDLEDAVAPNKKEEARFVVRNALRSMFFYGAERMVRINQGEKGLDDLEYLVPHGVNLILVPKVEGADRINEVNLRIASIQKRIGSIANIWLMPIIESAKGTLKAYEIASAENVVALAIGLEDYTADIGVARTKEATESFFARSMLVNAAKAAGIQAIDSVFSDVSDMEALAQNVKNSKALGFDGMGCIHPRQIPVIHENFAPEEKEIEKAKKIVLAFEEAKAKGLGVVSLGTKMIDPPVVKRAERVVNLAISLGKLNTDWMNEE